MTWDAVFMEYLFCINSFDAFGLLSRFKRQYSIVASELNDPISPRARGVLFVLKGPYDLRVPPIVKISQEFESARLTKIILSKSTAKTL